MSHWPSPSLCTTRGDAPAGNCLWVEFENVWNAAADEDKWVVLSSDGLYSEEARGGGGGLDNQQVSDILMAAGDKADLNRTAAALAAAAVELGSTDDVTLVLLRLGPA